MKKRLFSILLAVVMIATAINLAPVMEVWATIGQGYGKYDGSTHNTLYSQGHWLNKNTYLNDGDYGNITETYKHGDTGGASKGQDFKNRHVTIFHDCSYNTARNGYLIDRNNSTKYTNRGRKFQVVDNIGGINDKEDGLYTVTKNSTNVIIDKESNYYASFKPTQVSDGGDDLVFIFRNYYNTDYTSYGTTSTDYNSNAIRNYTPSGKGTGIDITEYDYFEFDFKVTSGLNFKKSRNAPADPTDAYVVYFYYETNDGSDKYLWNDSQNNVASALEGSNWAKLRFDNRETVTGKTDPNYQEGKLNFNASGKSVDGIENDWITIRIPLDSLKGQKTKPTVKQVSIRICGGWSANSGKFHFDDLRFVKNDDHVGMAYTDTAKKIDSSYAGGAQYPSGEYFMINDFEYPTDAEINSQLHNGQMTPFYRGTNTYPSYNMAVRYEEWRTDDNVVNTPTSDANWNNSSTKDYVVCGPDIVTQGNAATVLSARSGNEYGTMAEGWQYPFYYQREYSTPMDLSKYTHFAIDVYVRWGIKPVSGTTLEGATFCVELYDKDTLISNFKSGTVTNPEGQSANVANLKTNHRDSWGVKFTLPYGKECWDTEDKAKYGKIVPLNNLYKSPSGNATASGSMRFIFTREDLLAAAGTYFPDHYGKTKQLTADQAAVDYSKLSQIDGMRFLWLNRAGQKQYDSNVGNVDVFLDNFIAYTPDTSITIQNVTPAGEDFTVDGDNQHYIYDIYGGYNSTEAAFGKQLGTGKPKNLGYNGVDDSYTKNCNTTVAVPKNGKVTLTHMPFNSYYVTQQTWSWRYMTPTITSTDPYANDEKRKLITANDRTAFVLPRISLDGSSTRSVSILDVMKQRNFTITFTQKRTNSQWLDHNTVDYTNFLPSQK